MLVLAGTAARVPSTPTISVGSPTLGSLQIGLVTPSVEPISGVSSYDLERSSDGINFALLFNIAPNAFPFVDVGLSSGTRYFYRARGVSPFTGYRSNASPVQSAVTSSSSATVRWHPGHYMLSDRTIVAGQTYASTLQPQVQVCAATDSRCQGYALEIFWAAIENNTPGSYDFTFIDALLADLVAAGKMLWIVTEYTVFGGGFSGAVPAYIMSNAATYGGSDIPGQAGVWSYGPAFGTSFYAAAVWRPAVSARYIALQQALANHYASNPNVEMIGTNDESATGANVSYAGSSVDFTPAAYNTHWTNVYAAMTPLMPSCNIGGCLVNFSDGDAGNSSAPASNQLIATAFNNPGRKVGMGWPDTVPSPYSIGYNNFTYGQSAWRGEAGPPGTIWANQKFPCFAQMEGFIPNGTDFVAPVAAAMPFAVRSIANGGLNVTHFAVSYQQGSPGQNGDWATDTYPSMLANPVQNKAYPY